MELTPYLFWNIFITLVLAPVLYGIRSNTSENKRLDILLNRNREKIAKDDLTNQELKNVFGILINRKDRLSEERETVVEVMYKR